MYSDLIDSLLNTPLLELYHLSRYPAVRVFSKLEAYNPTATVYHRIVKHILVMADERR